MTMAPAPAPALAPALTLALTLSLEKQIPAYVSLFVVQCSAVSFAYFISSRRAFLEVKWWYLI